MLGRQRRQWHPTPVLLPGKPHGRKSLVGCSPWGREESDTTERLHFHFSLSCIGGGNGNPLQCSCLDNPRDGRAWWAAIFGVAQSWTQLKWLSSSSSSMLGRENNQITLRKAWKWKCQALGLVGLSVTPYTVACQALLSMEFSRQEHWSGLPSLSPGDLPNPGIKPRSLAFQADSLTSEPGGKLVSNSFYTEWKGFKGITESLQSYQWGLELI